MRRDKICCTNHQRQFSFLTNYYFNDIIIIKIMDLSQFFAFENVCLGLMVGFRHFFYELIWFFFYILTYKVTAAWQIPQVRSSSDLKRYLRGFFSVRADHGGHRSARYWMSEQSTKYQIEYVCTRLNKNFKLIGWYSFYPNFLYV